MKICFDIVHPADVLFFFNPIRQLSDAGHQICIASRNKDITTALLDRLHLPHTPISRAGRGLWGLGSELLQRDVNLARFVRRERPDVLTGFGGIAAAHVGRLFGLPSIVFYDTDTAGLQTRITYPFLTELHVPESYRSAVPSDRTHWFRGVKEFSFLHPDYFRPDIEKAMQGGFDPERDNFFLRIVSWGANHDIGHTGWSDNTLRAVVSELSANGRVHISSERELPPDLRPHLYSGTVETVHHLIAHCRLYAGESATMASEAIVLGVPAIFCGPIAPGYIGELQERNLLHYMPQPNEQELLRAIRMHLNEQRDDWLGRRARYLAECDDIAAYVVEALLRQH